MTVCNRDVLKSTVISNIYKDDMSTVFKNVKNSINKISSGTSILISVNTVQAHQQKEVFYKKHYQL